MFGPFTRRPRERTPEERRKAAVKAVLGEADFVGGLIAGPARPPPEPDLDPAWVRPESRPRGQPRASSTDTGPPEERPYLELERGELERYATLELVSPGPGLEEQAVGHAAGWVERLILSPMRTLFENFGWLLLTGATLLGVAVVAGSLLRFVVRLFAPMAE